MVIPEPPPLAGGVAPYGPGLRYGWILFIEKEGFNQLVEASGLCDKYDVGLATDKGQSTTATRELVEWCGSQDIPLLVVHDFDRAGLEIASVLQRDTRRYQFTKRFKVIDLGLRLGDVQRYNLSPEKWRESMKGRALIDNLRRSGANDEEIAYLTVGQRVELNAFTSP